MSLALSVSLLVTWAQRNVLQPARLRLSAATMERRKKESVVGTGLQLVKRTSRGADTEEAISVPTSSLYSILLSFFLSALKLLNS